MASFVFNVLLGTSILLQAAGVDARSTTDTPEVHVDSGALRGSIDTHVIAFKGIPFAAPPVGPLRWRAPQASKPWPGVRDARAYGPDCMQLPFPSDAAPLGTAPSEDCLYANVWRPAGTGRKLPVMVWIYGGGFVNGGASPPTYAGDALARQGIVVVSFNYRLGRFGAFAHPQLTAADPDHGLLANYGFMDQLAALRWVQRNVAAFGGDPAKVTIVGESAGGMSVHALITSPLAKGLFQRAVIQSGGTGSSGGKTLATAEAAGVAFARAKNIQRDDPQALPKLRALTGSEVVNGLNLASMGRQADGSYTGPVADGRIAVDALTAYGADRFAHVPVMIGATSADIGGANGMMIGGARDLAALLARRGIPIYYYRFDYVAGSVRTSETKGAGHASDIPFFFDTAAVKYGAQTTATDRAAGRLASSYLVNFVKTGNPNAEGLPNWPAYGSVPIMLTFTPDESARSAPDVAGQPH
jgi:para-nitrobenzyl esterase